MKIDKRNPLHWLYLARFAFNVLVAMLLRAWRSGRGNADARPLVLLYGHQLNGNLASLYTALRADAAAPCEVVFLTMDPAYRRELAAAGTAVVGALGWEGVLALARARVLVSDHGLHVMSLLPRVSSIRFVDVWHGVPFKGWDAHDFAAQHAYDEVWVSSELIRRFYIERFGFKPEQVHATGYGRTDRLVRRDENQATLRRAIGAPPAPTRLILFAPTWQHGSAAHTIFPFESAPEVFLAALARLCAARGAVCLFRTHLNTRAVAVPADGPFLFVPQDRFPDSEGVLLVSDLLVCDWSSIAFDFLVLQRPTIFLDVPAPFTKGFTLGPEYRFGAIAGDLAMLCACLDRYLADPAAYAREHGARVRKVMAAAYDDRADGQAAARYVARLRSLL